MLAQTPPPKMAPTAVTARLTTVDDDEELSDEQIQQLIGEAEARLTSPSAISLRVTASIPPGRPLPRLQTVMSHTTYIREKNGIAIVDPKLLISEEQKKLSDTSPTVDIASKGRKLVRTLRIPSLEPLE